VPEPRAAVSSDWCQRRSGLTGDSPSNFQPSASQSFKPSAASDSVQSVPVVDALTSNDGEWP
jgi:hypothetical protein